jgi:hypothetical protein
MKQIIEVRTNFMKFHKEKGGFLDMAEVILLAHNPSYEVINKQVVKRDSVEQFTFMASKEAVQGIIEQLMEVLTQLEENEQSQY